MVHRLLDVIVAFSDQTHKSQFSGGGGRGGSFFVSIAWMVVCALMEEESIIS